MAIVDDDIERVKAAIDIADVIAFVSEMDGIDYASAVERLASSVGITLHHTDSPDGTTSTQ